jgi:hypothetical protein
MFSCVTVPSIVTCSIASAISASNIDCAPTDPGWFVPDGPGPGVDGGVDGVDVPLLHPIAATIAANPNSRTVFMLAPSLSGRFGFLEAQPTVGALPRPRP